jgi:uncharacterized protein YcgL (UPF0745 family)
MHCIVYKSARRADAYVYVLDPETLKSLPAELAASLGALVEVLRFDLTPDRKLARVDAASVRANLASIGFHIQFPPDPSAPIGDPRNLGRS